MIVHYQLLHEIFGVPAHRPPEDAVTDYVSLFLNGLRARPALGRKTRPRGRNRGHP
jgi:hypothetical protein